MYVVTTAPPNREKRDAAMNPRQAILGCSELGVGTEIGFGEDPCSVSSLTHSSGAKDNAPSQIQQMRLRAEKIWKPGTAGTADFRMEVKQGGIPIREAGPNNAVMGFIFFHATFGLAVEPWLALRDEPTDYLRFTPRSTPRTRTCNH